MVVEKRNFVQSHPDFTVPGPISAMSTARYPEKQRQWMFPVHDLVLHVSVPRVVYTPHFDHSVGTDELRTPATRIPWRASRLLPP